MRSIVRSALLLCFLCFCSPAGAVVPSMETLKGEQAIRLQSLDIRTEIRGGLAETTLRMVFFNPNQRQLEGNLQFPLLDGQQITGFALDFDRKLRAAVPVDKPKARQVFEEIERRGVDPGLLEKTVGNNFRLRVFPIPRMGTRTVEVSYSEALARDGDDLVYRLPLDYARLEGLTFSLRVDGTAGAPRVTGALGGLTFEREGRNGYRVDIQRRLFKPSGLVDVRLPIRSQAQTYTQVVEGDTYFVAEVPVSGAFRARAMPQRVGLLWDSSGSGAGRALDAELALLDAYFKAMGQGEVKLVRLRDRPEAPRTFRITGGDWNALRKEIENTIYDGASALADWQPEAGVDEFLLVSDGLMNYGPREFARIGAAQRLYAISSSAGADTARLGAVAAGNGGRLVQVTPTSIEAATKALLHEGPHLLSLGGEHVADLQAETLDPQNGLLRIAGRLLSTDAKLELRLAADGKTQTLRFSIADDAAEHPFAARLWASYRLAALEANHEMKRAEIRRLGQRFGLATRETSLIVLDTVEDYVRYEIAPPAELQAEYAHLRDEAERERTESIAEHIDEVIADFAKKIAWWEQTFPKGIPPLPAKKIATASGASASTGNIMGSTTPGAIVVVESEATGMRREATADTDGNYVFRQLPSGTYRVTAGGQSRTAVVSLGSNATATIGAVEVIGGGTINAIDVESVESTTILTAEQIAAVPVARNITNVALLAPGTVRTGGASRPAPAPAPPTADADETDSTNIAIALKKWSADAPYIARMAVAEPQDLYAIYLDEKPGYANSSAFFLDVADLLLQKGQRELALRVLSNLAEMDLENRQILRILGYRLLQADEAALALPVFEQVRGMAEEEPQSFRDLGLALAAVGRRQEAITALYEVVERPWDRRFAEIELIALAELNAIIATAPAPLDTSTVDARLLRNLPLDLRVVLTWDADNSDMDLWVTDPNGEKCFYGHKLTYQGGRMSDDFTGGYGPEEFSLRVAKPGKYRVEANYYGDRQQVVAAATTLQLELTTGFGTPKAKSQDVTLRLKSGKETVLVGEFTVE